MAFITSSFDCRHKCCLSNHMMWGRNLKSLTELEELRGCVLSLVSLLMSWMGDDLMLTQPAAWCSCSSCTASSPLPSCTCSCTLVPPCGWWTSPPGWTLWSASPPPSDILHADEPIKMTVFSGWRTKMTHVKRSSELYLWVSAARLAAPAPPAGGCCPTRGSCHSATRCWCSRRRCSSRGPHRQRCHGKKERSWYYLAANRKQFELKEQLVSHIFIRPALNIQPMWKSYYSVKSFLHSEVFVWTMRNYSNMFWKNLVTGPVEPPGPNRKSGFPLFIDYSSRLITKWMSLWLLSFYWFLSPSVYIFRWQKLLRSRRTSKSPDKKSYTLIHISNNLGMTLLYERFQSESESDAAWDWFQTGSGVVWMSC